MNTTIAQSSCQYTASQISVDDTVCMNDTFCLFDVAVTGNPSIGKATLAARTSFADIKQLSKPG